jgi:hypothetical protein
MSKKRGRPTASAGQITQVKKRKPPATGVGKGLTPSILLNDVIRVTKASGLSEEVPGRLVGTGRYVPGKNDTARTGRSLVAVKEAKKGQLLLEVSQSAEKVAVLLDDLLLAGVNCGVCLAPTPSGEESEFLKACSGCHSLLICSKCRDRKIHCHNDRECKAYKALFRDGSILRNQEAFPLISDTTLERLLIRMVSNESDASMQAFIGSMQDLEQHYLKEEADVKTKMVAAVKNAHTMTGTSLSRKRQKMWTRIAARFRANEMMVSVPWRWRKSGIANLGKDDVGVGLFVPASYCNHSCSPNAQYTFEFDGTNGPTLVLRACKDILPGHEITITYESLYASSRDRQHELASVYHFQCACDRCRHQLVIASECCEAPTFDTIIHGFDCSKCDGVVVPLFGGSDDLNSLERRIAQCSGTQGHRYDLADFLPSDVANAMVYQQGEAMSLLQNADDEEHLRLAWGLLKGSKTASLDDPAHYVHQEGLLHSDHIARHAMRMMKIGIGHAGLFHSAQVEQLALEGSARLKTRAYDNEFDEWIAKLRVLAAFHGFLAATSIKKKRRCQQELVMALDDLIVFLGNKTVDEIRRDLALPTTGIYK